MKKRISSAVIFFKMTFVVLLLSLVSCDESKTSATVNRKAFIADVNTVGLWHIDEETGQTVTDSSGSGVNLNLGLNSSVETQDPTWNAGGMFSGCLDFDGSKSQLLYNNSCNIPLNDGEFSIELWYKPVIAEGMIFAADGFVFRVDWVATNKLSFDVANGSNWSNIIFDGTELLDGNWHYVACTYNGTFLTAFIDGRQVARDAPATSMPQNITGINIGGRMSNLFTTGSIDEVRLSNKARSASEISAYFNQ